MFEKENGLTQPWKYKALHIMNQIQLYVAQNTVDRKYHTGIDICSSRWWHLLHKPVGVSLVPGTH